MNDGTRCPTCGLGPDLNLAPEWAATLWGWTTSPDGVRLPVPILLLPASSQTSPPHPEAPAP